MLGHRQIEVLGQVIATNGGGLHAGFSESSDVTKVLRSLECKGLVQGMSGNPQRAVHTKEGLRVWRQLKKESPTHE
jgi:hypothetical protein